MQGGDLEQVWEDVLGVTLGGAACVGADWADAVVIDALLSTAGTRKGYMGGGR